MRIVFTLTFVFTLGWSFAQDYEQAFKNKQLINAQTAVIPDGFDFTIMHRFGEVALNEDFYKDFLGFDLPANIRFSLSYRINDRFYLGIGRTKIGKTIDVEGKYLLLRQTKVNSSPLSVAVFHSTGVSTSEFDAVRETMFFGDSITPFENKFLHRLSFNTQLILSKKFNEWLSLQLSPTVIYKNLIVGHELKHHTFVLPFSGRLQYSFGSAILFEYAHKLNNRSDEALNNPFSFGFEFGTAGHVFQVFATNSYYLRESNIYTESVSDIYDKPFKHHLGFNIRRVWWF